jgi:hypothetical protein
MGVLMNDLYQITKAEFREACNAGTSIVCSRYLLTSLPT